jgi:hypothetical protein
MKLILAIMGTRKTINLYKLEEASKNLGRRDTILVSGSVQLVVRARHILGKLGVPQNRILLDIKRKATRELMKEYINDYPSMLLISENYMEERLIRSMYDGKLETKRIGND